MLSPVDGLGSVDTFQMMDKDTPDFEKPKQRKSLFARLLECYQEESQKQLDNGEPIKEAFLLERVVKEYDLSVLIVNLHAGNEGYSMMLKRVDGVEVETICLPYEENEFLSYLDLKELPPLLVDILDGSQVRIYHDGCVIVELRDYRKSKKNCDKSYILLKPTSQTIVRDVNSLMADSSKWSQEDKLYLESQLVLAMQPRLCLDPSPEVLLTANKIQYHANKWNAKGLKRSMRKFSQPYINRSMLCSNSPSPPCLRLLDFIHRHRDKRSVKLNRTNQHTDMWKQRTSTLTVPSKIDVNNYAKLHEQPKYTSDYTPEKIQEIILEGEKTNNRSYFCRVTIQRRGSTGEYIGDLYLEEDYSNPSKDDNRKDGRACRFSLGNRLTAQRYLQQFQELYTEEGRKSVKISTFVANQNHQKSSSSPAVTTASSQTSSSTQPKTSESTLTVNLSRTFAQTQNTVLSQGGTYILASSVPGLQQPLNLQSNVVMSLSGTLAQSIVSGSNTFSIAGNPYLMNASGNLQQAVTSKPIHSPAKICATQISGADTSTQFTTAYIQPVVSGTATSVASHGQLTAVPIAVQGNNVSIVQGNMNAQYITKAAHQAIRPAGAAGQIMLQVPGNLVPISQMTRVGQQKVQGGGAMASVMVHGKQVMVQGAPTMIQGQAAFIPNQTALIPGLQGTQTAIIQGNSIFVQPNQSLVGNQHQGQTVMIQGQPGQHPSNTGNIIQGQPLQGQAVFIQGQHNNSGQGSIMQGQTIMLQNQSGHQGQVQLITTTSSTGQQQLQIVPHMQKQAATPTSMSRTNSTGLPSQVNLIPVQQGVQQPQYRPIVHFTAQTQGQQSRPVLQRRRTSTHQPTTLSGGNKKRPQAPNKPSPT